MSGEGKKRFKAVEKKMLKLAKDIPLTYAGWSKFQEQMLEVLWEDVNTVEPHAKDGLSKVLYDAAFAEAEHAEKVAKKVGRGFKKNEETGSVADIRAARLAHEALVVATAKTDGLLRAIRERARRKG